MKPTFERKKQSGAALVVGLLLLLVLTLLAISGMNTASLELVMAGNTQFHQNAFQAAETGIEFGLRNADLNPAAAPVTEPVQTVAGTSDKFTLTTTPQANGMAQPALWGDTWDSFSTFHFELRSVGTSARNANATTVQAVAVIAPADSTVTPGVGLPSTVLE